MTTKNRTENLNLYASLLRKYYIGEEDYMYVTLLKITRTDLDNAWYFALQSIKHDERIKSSSTASDGYFSTVIKRYDGFKSNAEIIHYLFSRFEPSKLKLNEENIERRLRYLLALKILKYLEREINSEFILTDLQKKTKKEEDDQRKKLINEFYSSENTEYSSLKRFKKISSRTILFLIILLSLTFYYAKQQINKFEIENSKVIKAAKVERLNLKQEIKILNNQEEFLKSENQRLNELLQNEEYLSKILNEKKFYTYKQTGFTGEISFKDILGYKLVKGRLIDGEERGFWVYEKYNGEKEKYNWISERVGAICYDGHRSYATGRGACSHHGGVSYWLNDFRRVRVNR